MQLGSALGATPNGLLALLPTLPSYYPPAILPHSVHLWERSSMRARGAAVLVGVNGLLALEAIDPAMLEGLLNKSIKLDGSGKWFSVRLGL